MKTTKIVFNWLIFIAFLAGVYFASGYLNFLVNWWRSLPVLSGIYSLIFGLSIAFFWVEVKRWGHVKPFNCLKCLTGWFTFIIAFTFHTPFAFMYLFVGVFVGSLFEAIKLRYL